MTFSQETFILNAKVLGAFAPFPLSSYSNSAFIRSVTAWIRFRIAVMKTIHSSVRFSLSLFFCFFLLNAFLLLSPVFVFRHYYNSTYSRICQRIFTNIIKNKNGLSRCPVAARLPVFLLLCFMLFLSVPLNPFFLSETSPPLIRRSRQTLPRP